VRVRWRFALAPLTVVCLAVLSLPAPADDGLPPGDSPSPTVFSRLEEAGTSEDNDGADEVIVYDLSTNRVKPSGVTYVDNYVVRKVLTSAGCRDLSVLSWRYEPWSSHIEVRRRTSSGTARGYRSTCRQFTTFRRHSPASTGTHA